MLTFLVKTFWFLRAVGLLFVLAIAAYTLCLILSDVIMSRAKAKLNNADCADTTESLSKYDTANTSQVDLGFNPPLTDTLLEYLNEHHSPLHPVRYDDHLFSSLDMDSLDIQALLRYLSDIYHVELPIVDLFGRYGADPTVYQVLCYVSRQCQVKS